MTQRGYAQQTLETFNLQDFQPASTPMVERLKLKTDMNEEFVDPTLYRSMVGKLIHLTHSRPDLSYSVGIVSRYYMAKPQNSHLQAVKRIFRYVSGTRDYGIMFRKGDQSMLTGYVDSDYAGDAESGRSTTGFVFQLGNSPITWHSKKQPTVALSSTEAQYRALSDSARETIWLMSLLKDLGFKKLNPVTTFCENESSIKLAYNPVFISRTKHITTHYHFVREKVASGEIQVLHVPTIEQTADLLTKPLGKLLFEKFRDALQITSSKDYEHSSSLRI